MRRTSTVCKLSVAVAMPLLAAMACTAQPKLPSQSQAVSRPVPAATLPNPITFMTCKMADLPAADAWITWKPQGMPPERTVLVFDDIPLPTGTRGEDAFRRKLSELPVGATVILYPYVPLGVQASPVEWEVGYPLLDRILNAMDVVRDRKLRVINWKPMATLR